MGPVVKLLPLPPWQVRQRCVAWQQVRQWGWCLVCCCFGRGCPGTHGCVGASWPAAAPAAIINPVPNVRCLVMCGGSLLGS
eukprot:1158701-Pelagomonas_calceolata.AAC.1